MMKSGASKLDQNAITKFANGENMSAEQISQKMQIPLKCVKQFMPDAVAARKAGKKEELSPQQRAAITRKANAEKAGEE